MKDKETLNHVTLIHPMNIRLAERRVMITSFDAETGDLSHVTLEDPGVTAWCAPMHAYRAHVLYGPRETIKMRVTLLVPFANISGIVPPLTQSKDG